MAGLYIHIPFCRQKCAYCDFPSAAGRESDAGRYFSALIKEAEMWRDGRVRSPAPTLAACAKASLSSPDKGGCPHGGRGDFHTVFIGGGTPSLLPAGELERLMDGLRSIFDIRPVEFTVEANPGTVDKAKLLSFLSMGANRLSMGAQAAQDGLLKRIGRIHTWAEFVHSYETAREAGFQNVNVDMMTGLPGQTVNDAADTAKKLAALKPGHVSCYGLILEEGTPLAQAVQKGDEVPPDDDCEREMFHAARSELEGAGLKRYEISNFARPGLECLHNLNYWHNGNWLGLGPGAASHFSGYRRENHAGLDAYMAALESGNLPPYDEHDIGADEAVFETIMLELRLVEGIDLQRFHTRYGFDFMGRYGDTVQKFVLDGLMNKTPSGITLTELGMDLQNTVLMDFLD